MVTDVILPALGMAQDTGKIVQWLKTEGEQVAKGEPLVEIETDKATAEIESPADGVLARITASAGDDIPVGQVIAVILAPGEKELENGAGQDQQASDQRASRTPTPLASRIAAEHHLNLGAMHPAGRRIQKADVLIYLQNQDNAVSPRLVPASPKARRLASEQGKQLTAIKGSGPGGAVLAADVLAETTRAGASPAPTAGNVSIVGAGLAPALPAVDELSLSNIWRIMAQRTTQSWTTVPHFSLVREVNASRLISWRKGWERLHPSRNGVEMQDARVTYTDLLVKIVVAALRLHPRLNACWNERGIALQQEIHIGLAVAVAAGLVVPVIHYADKLALDEIAQQRSE